MRGPARIATYLGRILMAVGFFMIVFAWNGASSLDFIQGQFPYLLSGAIPGMALIIVGAGTEYIQAVRQMTAQRAKQMSELNLAMVRLAGHVRDAGGFPSVDETPAAIEAPERVAVAAGAPTAPVGTSAFAAPVGAASADEDPSSAQVIAGRSSFHLPTCHLVSGRDDMNAMSRLEAEGQGLNPCRVCKA